MKRLSMIMMCLFTMMAVSLSAIAQEVTITLFPGWNWISYPKAEMLDINTALGDFVPVNGDILKSQFGSSSYANGYWRGGVTHFMPGWGYMYFSNRTEIVSFVFGEPAPQLIVTTMEPTDITAISAISGGSLTSSDGSYIVVLEKGICWATHPNPTAMNDFHTENGSGIDSFTTSMTCLVPNTMYYVRAYAVTQNGTIYGDELVFNTLDDGYHAYVDLGLPSGLLWATCNLGANFVEDYGDYYAWGETQPKNDYSWNTYQYGNGYFEITKYCSNPSYGYQGFCDDLTTLLPEDDAATANWGSDWRIPTEEEWQELYQHTTHTWTIQNGVYGRLFTAENGNSLFLPAAGRRLEDILEHAGSFGDYWSSSLSGNPGYARGLLFNTSVNYTAAHQRFFGIPVRPVRSINTPTGAINSFFSVGEDQQVYFSKGNLQYIGSASTPYWKFAENQWEILGDNGQASTNQTVDRDFFGWGTSGYNHGAIAYQPWSTSRSYSDYFAYGQSDYNLFDQTGQADWGYNAIVNGGNTENSGWRTLTKEEWSYLLNTRSTGSDIRFAKALVNGVFGVIILPDSWSSDYYSLNNTNIAGAIFSSNIISASDWTGIFEANGAVFLAVAGCRGTNSIVNEDIGYYWSSSCLASSNAYFLYFDDITLSLPGNYSRVNGFSVRLVKDYNP